MAFTRRCSSAPVVSRRLYADRCLVRLCLKVRALREHAGGAGDGEYVRGRNVAAGRG
jgi:hypothetical protein